MKITIIFLLCGFSVCDLTAQNLVTNPSFEDTVACSTYADNIADAQGWFSCAWSPDYFNPCGNLSVPYIGVPINVGGHQTPYDGNAYAGIVTYTNYFPFPYRECIGVHLLDKLIPGYKYYVSAFVSRADTFELDCATNGIGFRFSINPYSIFNPVPVDNYSAVHTDSIIISKTNWTRIEGNFIAD
ncbi:MAG: hypothetical protein ABI729_11195, partial [Chitinophagales bacterium]